MAIILRFNALGATQGIGGAAMDASSKIKTLIGTFNVLKTSQIANLAVTNGLNEVQLRSLLSVVALTEAQKKEILTLYADILAKQDNADTTDKGTISNNKLALSFENVAKGALASAKAFAVAHPVLTALMAAAAVIFAVSKIHDALTISLEEHSEMLSEAKNKYSEITSELSSYQSELETTQVRIKEFRALQLKGTISAAEEKELDDLKRVNAELERKIALLELEQVTMCTYSCGI